MASPYTITVDANGLPATSGTAITVPLTPSIGGVTTGFYAGRVYAPSATPTGQYDLTVFFAGYHTPKPKNGLGDYRTISRITLHSSQAILATSTNLSGDTNGDKQGNSNQQ
ncbi:MAG TPA: hypothetical protein VFN26_10590 [Candidatus Acidoferrum sp.]|nr:hypothetical protein [Candidatus Acidoferrum sp.]